jgi:hypothetical protein
MIFTKKWYAKVSDKLKLAKKWCKRKIMRLTIRISKSRAPTYSDTDIDKMFASALMGF